MRGRVTLAKTSLQKIVRGFNLSHSLTCCFFEKTEVRMYSQTSNLNTSGADDVEDHSSPVSLAKSHRT